MNLTDSLNFVLSQKKNLGDIFYEKLLQYEEMKPHFASVNMKQQAVLLTMQLTMIESWYRRQSPAARQYLRILGTRHRQRNIPKTLFPQFCDVLLEALGRIHGPEWNEQLEDCWRTAVNSASEVMFEGYEENFHV